ncbi:MAG: DUF1638 domain-containing protein [Bacillota bacterium]|nr:DUF1638 domain-containing protein [Bacillota bacterium]
MKETVVIACDVLKEQLEALDFKKYDYIYLDQLLHRYPDELRKKLQEAVDSCNEYREILFAYGLCSTGVVGIKTGKNQQLIIPRTHDCIALSLGSHNHYVKLFKELPGTYYFTPNWALTAKDPYKEYLDLVDNKKYDEETAKWAVQQMMVNYSKAGYIDTGVDQNLSEGMEYVKKFSEFFSLDIIEIKGSLDYLNKLLSKDWDQENFVIVPPDTEVKQSMFETIGFYVGSR